MWRPFILPPCTTRDRTRSSNAQFGSACARVPVYCLASLVVVVGIEDRPPFSDLGSALRHRSAPSSGVTLVSPRGCRTKGLPMAKGLCHPARSCARRAHSVNTIGRSKHEPGHLFQLQLCGSSHVLTGEPRGWRGVPSHKAPRNLFHYLRSLPASVFCADSFPCLSPTVN